jgi:hypothetical protein
MWLYVVCNINEKNKKKLWNHSNTNVILQTTYSHIPNKQLDDANKQRR